jgi:hypothetical protein
MQRHAQPAHAAMCRQPLKLWADVVGEEIRVADDALGKPVSSAAFCTGDSRAFFAQLGLHITNCTTAPPVQLRL